MLLSQPSGNLLTKHLPLPMGQAELARRLHRTVQVPDSVPLMPVTERIRQIHALSGLHFPSMVELQLASAVQHMIHDGYRERDPDKGSTWNAVYDLRPSLVAKAALVTGVSGMGKSTMIGGILGTLPKWVDHDSFPRLVTGLRQLVWLKVSAPPDGRLLGLAVRILDALKSVLEPDATDDMNRSSLKGPAAARLAMQRLKSHYLGALVIDEVQNLFKLSTVAERKRPNAAAGNPSTLRLVEDETLKFLLEFSNESGIPLILIGTPDALRGFQNRTANTLRLTAGGHFELPHPTSSAEPFFSKVLLPQLVRYQWMERPLEMSDELRDRVFNLTAGIPRIVVSLWQHAQIYAVEQRRKDLRLSDLDSTFAQRMGILRPAVDALLSGKQSQMALYEDLLATVRPV